MPYSTANHPREAYKLLQGFILPTEDGPKWAISVTVAWSNAVVSIYSIMLEAVFVYFWILCLSILILFTQKPGTGEHTKLRIHVFNKGVVTEYLDAIVKLWPWPFKYTLRPKHSSLTQKPQFTTKEAKGTPKKQSLLWVSIILCAWLIPKAAPIFLILPLQIGQSAPVSADYVYIPHRDDISHDNNWAEKDVNIHKAPALRALSVVQVADEKLLQAVQVDGPRVLFVNSEKQEIQAVDYGFNLSTLDFGLSKFDGLVLELRGSCYTEYGWYNSSASGTSEVYDLFGDKSVQQEVRNTGWAPVASFAPGPDTDSSKGRNRTFAIFVSSFDRWSISKSTDPLYRTEEVRSNETNPQSETHRVIRKRPALHCWTQSSWRYKGHDLVGTWGLPDTKGLGITNTWRDALWSLLEINLSNVGTYLGSIALASSDQTGLYAFDAGACSLRDDLRRLVLTTRVYMANSLIDTTLYNRSLTLGIGDTKGYTNLLTADNQKEVANFVLNAGEGISTLDITFLIVVPCVQFVMFIITYGLRYYAKKKACSWNNTETVGSSMGNNGHRGGGVVSDGEKAE
ncbi:hypothetical protein BKA65DRAFT_596886 [Rhexocercosporidium sp. MPI-PUGE-AT-0058]|nr:hypothetical protein BKA65DRAFT_596886 [Rhexocercosporidium sp. MPI-PUGE-AT-0058]